MVQTIINVHNKLIVPKLQPVNRTKICWPPSYTLNSAPDRAMIADFERLCVAELKLACKIDYAPLLRKPFVAPRAYMMLS